MARKYRVVREAPKPQMPVAALDLAEDTERLRWALALLRRIDCESIGAVQERRDFESDIRVSCEKLRRWIRFSENRMRKEFLKII